MNLHKKWVLIPLQVIQIIVTEFTIFNSQNIFNRIRKHFSSYTYATICLRLSEDIRMIPLTLSWGIFNNIHCPFTC